MSPAEGLIAGAEPGVIEYTVVLGGPKFERFKILKNSARNCRLVFSVMPVFLKTEKSTFASPGPVSVPLPKFPYVPGVGTRKAAGLNHWSGFPVTTGPVKAGFIEGRSGFLVSPSPDRLDPIRGVKGKPERNVPMPLN